MKCFIRYLCLLCVAMIGCHSPAAQSVTVFYAPSFLPIMEPLQIDFHWKNLIHPQVAGSQLLCRMVNDLGRECDVLLLADAELFQKTAAAVVRWRIEFAHDEMVLGVGVRAQRVDEAEKDWQAVIQDPAIQLGRVDERLAPLGYRTLMVWKLADQYNGSHMTDSRMKNQARLTDQADHLAALLKNGDVDYGFLYKTTCLQVGIRFISLDAAINLGTEGYDYSQAIVSFQSKANGNPVTILGSCITYGVSIPVTATHPQLAREFIRVLLSEQATAFRNKGYIFFKPRFYGTMQDYQSFQLLAEYGGEF